MGIFETYYKYKRAALNESKLQEATLDESAILIEYIQELEEKLGVFTKGADKNQDEYTKSRGRDDRKTEPQVASVRKNAADKIRASRAKHGGGGTRSLVHNDHENFSVHKL